MTDQEAQACARVIELLNSIRSSLWVMSFLLGMLVGKVVF